MGDIYFFNIEYIILWLQELITGVEVDPSGTSSVVIFALGQIMILGTALSVLILALLVFVSIRLQIVEHEGFHAREVEAHAPPAEGKDIHKKNERWEHILSLAASAQESDWRRAIIEADVMLGALLTDKGYQGQTIGDQLKDANPLQFTTLDLAWKAHKVRNDIAHGGETFQLTERDTRATIQYYGRVFEEFGII